ncbi:antibiotic biosynthesis monooxygenase family protein [Pectobacterium jejuense]|uniref:Antibiotic biosynthesis monooxygenase family protein n=1 Tax=Pectobacterium jejuense TaxID=2974022 RepID=A0ABW8GS04_9GAMM
MIAVIFEVWPVQDKASSYFDIAASLRPELDLVDGFISIERFESLTTKGKYLSLSFWRDEDAVRTWRNKEEHRYAQSEGRHGVFANYRLRVGSIMRDYGLNERNQAPKDSLVVHD